MSAFREILPKPFDCFMPLFQGCEGIAQHCLEIIIRCRLVENPECFDIIGIQFKKLANQTLWNFRGSEVHLIESTKQSEQVQPSDFQTGTKIGWNVYSRTAFHDREDG